MVTGFNVNVKHAGKTFHVQTEDRGRKNPVIETLVYLTGKIIHQERVSYADQNDDAVYDEKAIAKLVDLQHRRMMDSIRGGRFDVARPFGEEFITNRTFDECVLDFLVQEASLHSLALHDLGQSPLVGGKKAWVEIRATDKKSGGPIKDAVIRSRVIRAAGGPLTLPELKTDGSGEARIEFDMPEGTDNVALIVQAISEAGSDELQKLLR